MIHFGLEFVLFAILGWVSFKPPSDKQVLMIVYVVLMILWAVGYFGTVAGWFPAK